MFMDNLNPEAKGQLIRDYLSMLHYALVQVFDKREWEAHKIVQDLKSRFENAPPRQWDLMLHNDPVALACELVGAQWSDVDSHRLAEFNKTRAPMFEKPFPYL